MRLFSCIIVLLFVAINTFGQELTWNDKISDKVWIEIDEEHETVPVIIMMQNQLVVNDTRSIKGKIAKATYVFDKLEKHSLSSQKEIRAFLNGEKVNYHSYKVVNAIATSIPVHLIEELAKRDDVSNIKYDGLIPLTKIISEENQEKLELRAGEPEWGIRMIKADSVWEQFNAMGEGVVVGGQDTGYKWDLPQLKDKYRGNSGGVVDHNYSWHDAIRNLNPIHSDTINPCGLDLDSPCDDNNHGTHTMGTMVGSDSVFQIGVAPAAQWIGCRNMDRGYGSPSTYTECFEWFLAPTDLNGENPNPAMSPHVINNSWGCPEIEGCNTDNFEMMNIVVQNLRAAGIVVVVSAGNSGSSCFSIRDPAAIFEGSFTVGASNIRDTITSFSSRGLVAVDGSFRMKPNVVAPGAGVKSILRDSSFASWNGTSMAGPHVAGAVALLISAVPELAGEVDLIEDILEETAVPKFSTQVCDTDSLAYPNPTFGFGRIDILAAVKRAQVVVSTSQVLNEEIEFTITPNPANNYLELSFPKGALEGSLKIFNINGAQVYESDSFNAVNRINLSDWADGQYIVSFITNKGFNSKKLLVIR